MTDSTRTYRMQARADGVGRTRERILAAARDHFVERAYDEVRLTEVASDAGVTQQTLLNHFSSKEGLFLGLVEVLTPEIEAMRGEVAPGDVRDAVRALMRQYEALGDANTRLQAVVERIPVLGQAVETARAHHVAWLERIFGEQLPAERRDHRRALAALYAVTDVGTWKLLRRDLGHSRAETTAVLEALLRAVLATVPHP